MGTLAKTNNDVKENQVPGIFENFFNTGWLNNGAFDLDFNSVPPMNIAESNDCFEIELAVPGYNKKDFVIELNKNHLSIMVEKSEEHSEENKKIQKKEFSYHGFKRTVLLPNKLIDEKHISAAYDNGLLKITIQKPEEMKEKPPRTISVK